MATLTIEQTLHRAETLARRTAGDQVPDAHLSTVLTHLKRHRNVDATLALLAELKRSPFAQRFGRTKAQLTSLDEHVRSALQGVSDWNDAAAVVGWARRLTIYYAQGQTRNQGPSRPWK